MSDGSLSRDEIDVLLQGADEMIYNDEERYSVKAIKERILIVKNEIIKAKNKMTDLSKELFELEQDLELLEKKNKKKLDRG